MAQLRNVSKRVSSAAQDARSIRIRAGRRFLDNLDLEASAPLIHVVVVGQEDEWSNSLCSTICGSIHQAVATQCEARFHVLPHFVDMRIGSSMPGHEDFAPMLQELRRIKALCNNHFLYFVFIVADKPTKPRVPQTLPTTFFDDVSKYDERLAKRYQLNTNCVPPRYELNKSNKKPDDDMISDILHVVTNKACRMENAEYNALLTPDVFLQFQGILSEECMIIRSIAVITTKSHAKPTETYPILKDFVLSKLPSRHVFSLSGFELDVSTTNSIKQVLHTLMKKDVDNASSAAPNKKVTQDLHRGIYRHLYSWFAGKHAHVNKVMNYLRTDTKKSPLIVYGGSGCGKSALVAHCLKKRNVEAGKQTVVVTRYIGLSDNSRTFGELVLSVIAELSDQLGGLEKALLFGRQAHPVDMLSSCLATIGKAANNKNKNVVLVFDNVEDLEPADDVANWVPSVVPESVSLILCLDSSRNGTLDRILERFSYDADYLIRVDRPTLTEEEAISICQLHCSNERCKVTREQITSISNAFFQCRQVAYLQMILHHSLSWKSFTKLPAFKIGRTVRLAIQVMFEDLEAQLGVEFVSFVLALFACARDGVRLDEALLMAKLDSHAGPHTNIHMLRLLHKLRLYIVIKYIHRSRLLMFTTREFVYVIRKRYMSSESQRRKVHSIMASYFMKPSHLFKKVSQHEEKKAKVNPLGATRLSAVTTNMLIHSINLVRCVSELPSHLVSAHRLPEFVAICCNFKWVYLKLLLLSARELLRDLEDAAEYSADICYIRDAMESALDAFDRAAPNAGLSLCQNILCRLKGMPSSGQPPCLDMFVASVESFIGNNIKDAVKLDCLNAWVPCDALRIGRISGGCPLSCMSISDDQEHLIVGGPDGLVQLRNLPEGKLRNVWHLTGSGTVNDVSFNQTNDKILCKLEARLVVLDIRSGGVLKDISLPKHVTFEHLNIGSILCVSKQTVQLLNMHADEVSHTWHPRENAKFTCACLARGEEVYVLSDVGDMAIIDLELEKAVQANGSAKPDPRELGPCIIAAMDTGFVQVWSMETKKAVRGFDAHAKCVTFIEPFSDYKLLSVSSSRGIRVHNWRNGRLVNRAPIAADLGDPKNYHVKVDPGEYFVAVAGEYQVCVWILEKLVPLKMLWCHSARINDLQITDLDENVWRLISSGEDGLCRVWDIESQSELNQIPTPDASSIIAAKGSLVLTAHKDNIEVYKYSNTSPPDPKRYMAQTNTVLAGGEDFAFVCETTPGQTCVFVRNCLTGLLQGYKRYEESVLFFGVCSNGKALILYTYTSCHVMTFYHVVTMAQVNQFFTRDTIDCIASDSNSTKVALISNFGHVLVYDAASCSLRSLQAIPTLPKMLVSKMMPALGILLYVSKQSKVFVIDIREGKVRHDRSLAPQTPAAVTYSSAQQHLMYAIGGSSIWVLDLDNYTKAYKLETAVKGNVTEMHYQENSLVMADSLGYVTVLDPTNDQVLCVHHMEGTIQCFGITGTILSMLVDGRLARLQLSKRSGGVKRLDQNDFVQDLWRALSNTLGTGEVPGYLGLSTQERIRWGLDASPLPQQCTIL